MSLKDYHRKRDFKKTQEPKGTAVKTQSKGLSFVVQKHEASHLHYDFRLELDGVLKSWAIPKGPSLDPKQKRLAMEVEDHPKAYGKFEGTIPAGEYGAGTVMLWDRGRWQPDPHPKKALREGAIKFELKGEKLQGRWTLVRMKTGSGKAWLLIKEKDAFAESLRQGDILKSAPFSIKSGRDLEQIRSGEKSQPQKAKVAAAKERIKKKSLPKHPDTKKVLQRLKITHPDKVFYPDNDIRKIDIIEYYLRVADPLLEHIAERPLMLVRHPDGIGKKGFVQRHWTTGMPSAIKKVKVRGEPDPFFTVDSKAGLVALGQFAALELHIWNTHFSHIEKADQWVFDLDPDSAVPWDQVTETAIKFRKILKLYGLESFLKTTGGKGLHIVAPVEPRFDWHLAKSFAKAICEDVMASDPSLYLITMSKQKRKGKIFLDYLRNGRGATAVAPYSPRARNGAPVSMPIDWKDLKKGIKSDTFDIQNVEHALNTNPWKNFYAITQVPHR